MYAMGINLIALAPIEAKTGLILPLEVCEAQQDAMEVVMRNIPTVRGAIRARRARAIRGQFAAPHCGARAGCDWTKDVVADCVARG